MKFLVVLAFVCCCSASVVPNLVVLPYPFAQQYISQDALGQSTFGHFSFDHNQQQTRLADGSVVGYYSYLGADGKPAVTIYEAGRQGFRVTGSNILPEAPAVPEAPELVAPKAVEETAEVRAAREEFQKKFSEEASRSRRSVVPLPYVQPVATVATHKFETKQFENVDANTPADTKKIELTTREHQVAVPAIKYVQPFLNVKPVQGVQPIKYVHPFVSVQPAEGVQPIKYVHPFVNVKPAEGVQPITYTAASSAVLPYPFPYTHAFTQFPFVAVKAEE